MGKLDDFFDEYKHFPVSESIPAQRHDRIAASLERIADALEVHNDAWRMHWRNSQKREVKP